MAGFSNVMLSQLTRLAQESLAQEPLVPRILRTSLASTSTAPIVWGYFPIAAPRQVHQFSASRKVIVDPRRIKEAL
jgi:hypothetical protein